MTRKTVFNLTVVLTLALVLSGCATIFKGEYTDVSVKSEPDGARVFINGDYYGQTPLRLELKTNQSYTIEFKRDGYKTQVRHIKNEIGVGWVVLDVICGLVPVVIDALTGAWYDLDQKYVNVILERQQPAAVR
ncbi:MAG: PEGA domain-containing protein [Candidatus Aminicenantes bacterium]|nr:PEGA domain-containing protein [Candidatus Aminicenantes bacterium]